MKSQHIKIVREPERLAVTGVSRANWWRLERAGKAPKRVQLGKRTIGWLNEELQSWIAERAAEREVV